MKVIWTKFAIDNLMAIFEYYNEVANHKIASKIRDGLILESRRLLKNYESYQKELSLTRKGEGHRYLVKDNYKLIYKIIGDEIVITDVFDTRQNPSKINNPTRKL